jgi:hypothetical protein
MDKQGFDYLKKYSPALQVLSVHDLTDPAVLPASWLQVLSATGSERVNKTLELWLPFKQELQQILTYLERNLKSIDLGFHNGGYSLLYGIENDDKNIAWYEGRNPLSKDIDDRIRKHWNNIPVKLAAFYEQLHNGWFYFASESMGLAPVELWIFLGDDEWEILEQLGNLDFSLDDMLAIYANGMGDYVCLDVSKPNGEFILWWHTKAPMRNIDFWPIVDTWTQIGMTH